MKSGPIDLAGLEPATISFSEPQSGWMPLQVAQIHFFPHFARPGKDFAVEMRSLIERLLPEGSPIKIETPDADTVCIESRSLRLFIRGDDGMFSFDPVTENADFSVTTWDDPCGLPEQFFQMLAQANFKPQYRTDAKLLGDIAERLWQALQRRFQIAINDGSAQIYGRWREVNARFTRIHLDQLTELAVDISEVDAVVRAETIVRSILRIREGSDAVVYSVYVSGTETSARSKGTDAERRATAALVSEMKANPKTPRTKRDVIKEYIKRFKISRNSIEERVWPDALEQVPECTWGKAGRRSRTA